MSPDEIIWEFVSSERKDTELWPSIVAGAVIAHRQLSYKISKDCIRSKGEAQKWRK